MKGVVLMAVILMAGLSAADSWTLERRSADGLPAAAWSLPPEIVRCETETNTIDLLLVFDESACRWLGERGTVCEQYAKTCIKDLNQSLSYTGIDRCFTFRLAGILDLSPLDFGNFELSDLIATFTSTLAPKRIDDHVAEQIRRARDDARADLVAILTLGNTPNIYGYSDALDKEDLTAEGLYPAAEKAYCACRIDSITWRHVLLHELGHLFGAGHSEAQRKSPGPSLFAYSAAYRFHAGTTPLTTVTGYPEEKDGTVLPFFSSPDYRLTYTDERGATSHDIPVGTPTNDNTRTVLATYPFIAQYRAAKPTEAAAAFERNLAFTLEEGGRKIGSSDDAVRLRCGVRHAFKLAGLTDDVLVTVRRLPVGFSYDSTNRVVTGRAKEPGDRTTLFCFKSKQTGMVVRRRVAFTVENRPSWASGEFADDSGNLKISVAANGLIRLSARKAYRSETVTQQGFVGEEVDDAGNPVFSFEDGRKLICATGADGRPQGTVMDADGTIRCQAAKKATPRAQRRRKSGHISTPKNNKENET